MADVATYADGIGPEMSQLVEWPAPGATAVIKDLSGCAKSLGLRIHPYTFRTDALPANAPDARSVLDALFDRARVDGIFTDFTDTVVSYRRERDRAAVRA
jgi:glycerophosphoryl diester phosphodiesterase